MTPAEKAEAAKLVLESPIMKSAIADIREGLVVKLENIPTDDREGATHIKNMLQALKLIQVQLQKYLEAQLLIKQREKDRAFVEKTRERLA